MKDLTNQEMPEERQKCFREMTNSERKSLIREIMQAEGLIEGSGVQGKDLFSYERHEFLDLIKVTHCSPEFQAKSRISQTKSSNKNRTIVPWLVIPIAITCGMLLYYEQYP